MRETLHIEIPPQEYKREQVILTITANKEGLCAVVIHEVHKLLSWGLDQCKIEILKTPAYWCLTVKPTIQWNQHINLFRLEIQRILPPNTNIETKVFF